VGGWDYDECMTTEAKHFIERFEALPDAAKQEVLVELLRIAKDIDYGDITDEELCHAAAEVFAAMDAEEEAE
jgi:hypothetical protein